MFIGAIQSVSPDIYEAAELDGANRFLKYKLLNYSYHYYDKEQHHSHCRGKPDFLELERRFRSLDNKRA